MKCVDITGWVRLPVGADVRSGDLVISIQDATELDVIAETLHEQRFAISTLYREYRDDRICFRFQFEWEPTVDFRRDIIVMASIRDVDGASISKERLTSRVAYAFGCNLNEPICIDVDFL